MNGIAIHNQMTEYTAGIGKVVYVIPVSGQTAIL
jgi:hypothetical protein